MNPFIYPRVLESHEIVGRKGDLRYILGRLANRQSVAVVGLPHMGKTSLLTALQDEAIRQELVGSNANSLLVSYVDAMAVRGVESQAEFWGHVLQPITTLFPREAVVDEASHGRSEKQLLTMLKEQFNLSELRELSAALEIDFEDLPEGGKVDRVRELVQYQKRRGALGVLENEILRVRPHNCETAHAVDDSLRGVYETAVSNNFGTFVLEQLFRQLHVEGWRMVLLLDEFDDFLANDALHMAEFYGGLRTLAARSPGLVVVIAARQELEILNRQTQAINPHGSPYFNVFTERRLGSLTLKALGVLLARAGEKFNQEDGQFVMAVSGGYPYLAQVAAFELWEIDEEDIEGEERYRKASKQFYYQTRAHFRDVWAVLTDDERKAVTAVALLQMPGLINGRSFHVGRLTEHLTDYTPELDKLRRSGMVKRQDNSWVIPQAGFLWWLADEMWRTVRDEDSFTEWLQRQSLDGVFTRGERAWMGEAASSAAEVVSQGVPAIIEAFAKSLAG